MEIVMPRGDLRNIKFNILDENKKVVSLEFDEIFISFKTNSTKKDLLFQKKLSNGTITKDEENYYHFKIEPEDTNNLIYGTYVFDIELIKENLIKQTTVGKLEITDEVTFAINEGD